MGTRKRTLALIICSVIVIAFVVIDRRAFIKPLLKEYWARWNSPKNPSFRSYPAGPGGPSVRSGAPPFDRPVRARSDMQMRLGSHVIAPNVRFDMESSADTTWLSREQAHTGVSSLLLDKEYGPAFRNKVGDVAVGLDAIGVSMWLHCDGADPRSTIVVSIERAGTQTAWFGKELSAKEHEPGVWQRFQALFAIGDIEVMDDDLISVYLWNRGKERVFVDDMDLYFMSKDIHGGAGTVHGIGSDAPRLSSMRFIPIARVELLSPGRFGVVPGEPAPDPKERSWPFGREDRATLHFAKGDAVGMITAFNGDTIGRMRAWVPQLEKDLFGFERVLIRPGGNGRLSIIGFDIDPGNGADDTPTVAYDPAPVAAEILIGQ